jgi:hypothetical protein
LARAAHKDEDLAEVTHGLEVAREVVVLAAERHDNLRAGLAWSRVSCASDDRAIGVLLDSLLVLIAHHKPPLRARNALAKHSKKKSTKT